MGVPQSFIINYSGTIHHTSCNEETGEKKECITTFVDLDVDKYFPKILERSDGMEDESREAVSE